MIPQDPEVSSAPVMTTGTSGLSRAVHGLAVHLQYKAKNRETLNGIALSCIEWPGLVVELMPRCY